MTTSTTYSFEKTLFNIYLNQLGVDKYSSDENKIKLIITHATNGDTESVRYFENENSYELWLDSIVDDEDWTYNTARGLSCVIEAIEA